MQVVFLVCLAILAMVIFTYISARKNRMLLRKRLINGFGKVPDTFDPNIWSSVSDYWDRKIRYEKIDGAIDELTWSDLDMDDVFKRLDSCLTSVGDEVLYAALHQPVWQEEVLKEREKNIIFLAKHPQERLEIQMILSRLGKESYNDVTALIFENQLKALKNPLVYKILAAIPFLCLLGCLINFSLGLLCFLISIIINGGVYYLFRKEIARNLLMIRYLAGILRCCNQLLKYEKSNDLNLGFEKINSDYHHFKALAGKITEMITAGSSDLDLIFYYLKIITLYDFRTYNKVVELISKNQEAFHRIYKKIGELDFSIALASFRASLPVTVTPSFTKDLRVSATGLYHPLLKEPVTNDIELCRNSLITGSNASGKSTFVKALAINAIFAQTIYICTASQFSLAPCLPVTSMAVKDDILAGDSYFMAEIKSLKRTLDRVNDFPCICFIDEILKGTNTIERIAASSAILDFLNRKNCLCLIATHDMELSNILSETYDNYHFSETITDEEISFDYKLRQGHAQTKNAIALLNYLSFDQKIIDQANFMVKHFTENEKWSMISANSQS